MLKLVTDSQIYQLLVCDRIPRAQKFLWMATSDLKDMYVNKNGKMIPFLEVLSDLASKKIEIRLLHAKEPGRAFREDFDKYPNLIRGIERMLCPRVHLKCAVIDGRFAYTGSANITGAGLGAKSNYRRNFESGIITDEQHIINAIMDQFDNIWRGTFCKTCQRKNFCADFKDILSP